MNDLEYAARTVHDWPTEARQGLILGFRSFSDSRVTYIRVEHNGSISREIYKDQWLAERERLQNKPHWSEAPEWAEWSFQNREGQWVWFEKKPDFTGKQVNYKATGAGSSGEVLGDWRDTLEPRPEDKTMTKKEWRGPDDGLPPVGTICEFENSTLRDKEWHTVRICAYMEDNFFCAVRIGHNWPVIYRVDSCIFRPLQTEEEKEVEQMYREATGDDLCGDEMDDQDVVSLCQVLYKAGYRKQETSE